MRGWQGEAMIELQIDQNGRPASIKVQTSSGYETLDKTAMEMVRKTVAATRLPEILRGSSSIFLVPVASIGRASCRERGCTYVSLLVVAVSVKKKNSKKHP